MRKLRSFIIMIICLSLVTGCFAGGGAADAASNKEIYTHYGGHKCAARTKFGLVAKNVTSVKVSQDFSILTGWQAFITQGNQTTISMVDFLHKTSGKQSNYKLNTVSNQAKGFYPLYGELFILDKQNRLLHTGEDCYLFDMHAANHNCKPYRYVVNEVVETDLDENKCWASNGIFAYVKNNNLYIIGSPVDDPRDDCDDYFYQHDKPKVFFKGQGNNVKDVVCGNQIYGTIYVLMNDGSVWGMGRNDNKLISDSKKKNYKKFVKIISSGVKQIAANKDNVAIIKNNNNLYVWGHTMKSENSKKYKPSHKPKKIASNVVEVSAGSSRGNGSTSSLVFLKKNGTAYAMGKYKVDVKKIKKGWKSKPVKLMKNVEHIYAGDDAVLLLKKNKDLYWAGTAYGGITFDWVAKKLPKK